MTRLRPGKLESPLPHTGGGAGPRAVATLKPPDYGIDLVDRHPAESPASAEARPTGGGISASVPTPGGQPLPATLRTRMEGLLGVDLAPVRVHEGEAAESLGAVAFTRGHDICFARGRYEPHTPRGQRVLGHEIAHVVQQSAGRARATGIRRGVPINDAPHLEREADGVGRRATRDAIGGRRSLRSLASPVGDVAQCLVYQGILDSWVDGDKIYGLSGPRQETVNALENLEHRNTTLDDLNNQFLGTGHFTGKDNPDTYDKNIKLRDREAKRFQKALHKRRKYDPRRVSGRDKSETRVRQACKGGLEHVTRMGNTIHFILDGLNIQWVIQKTGPWDQMGVTQLGEKARDITGAEMRFLYRHRNDPTVMNNVRFWRGGQEVHAPWLEDPGAWDAYTPKSGLNPSKKAGKSKKKRRGCFLTTACTAARGLPDDCHELTTLRAFRDTYMRSLPGGPAMVDEYYEIAPRLVAKIARRDDAPALLSALYERVTAAVRLVEDERHADALALYTDMIRNLQTSLRGSALPGPRHRRVLRSGPVALAAGSDR